jgi:hypothetical protein
MRQRTGTKEDTLHRETLRTQAGDALPPATGAAAVATVLTPLPAAPSVPPPATPTLRTPLPSTIPPAPKMRKGLSPAYLVGFVAVIALVIAALVFWPRSGDDRPPIARLPETTTTTTPSATATSTPAVTPQATLTASQTSLTVTSPAVDTAPVLSAPIPTATVATTTTVAPAPVPAPVRPRREPVRPAPVPAPEPEETAEAPRDDDEPSRGFSSIPTYVDGGGDSTANDRALASLRRALRGTDTVALRAGAMQLEVMRALREYFPNLQFEAEAPVVIRFSGSLERQGIGRRRRGATATIEKNGQLVFKYELPNEVYRVGMSPARAFARVVADAVE